MEKYQEPEENIIDIDYNPLDEAVNEKRYTQSNVDTSKVDFTKPIEEPRFTPPPFEQKKFEQKKAEPINPELKNLSKKETEMASAQMCKLILSGYDWVLDLANKNLQVSEKKLNKLQAEGTINLNAMIDYDYGKKVRAGEFFQLYNQQVQGLLKVSDEFKEEVTPVMERVLAKRGIGLTDEQTLMYVWGKELATQGIRFFQQKSQMNYMLKSIQEATASIPQEEPQPQPQPQPQREEKYQEPEEKTEKSEVLIIDKPRRKGRPRKV
jgi:hypothetical protein